MLRTPQQYSNLKQNNKRLFELCCHLPPGWTYNEGALDVDDQVFNNISPRRHVRSFLAHSRRSVLSISYIVVSWKRVDGEMIVWNSQLYTKYETYMAINFQWYWHGSTSSRQECCGGDESIRAETAVVPHRAIRSSQQVRQLDWAVSHGVDDAFPHVQRQTADANWLKISNIYMLWRSGPFLQLVHSHYYICRFVLYILVRCSHYPHFISAINCLR